MLHNIITASTKQVGLTASRPVTLPFDETNKRLNERIERRTRQQVIYLFVLFLFSLPSFVVVVKTKKT